MTKQLIENAVKILQRGDVIAYPTEAVWGLGCDPFNAQAFAKILQLKQRPIEKGVILLISDIQQINFLMANLSSTQYQKVLQFWENTKQNQQQATTWLFPTHDNIPKWITGQYQQVAIRLSHHPICQQLCQHFGGFIVSTSANPHGLSPATTAQQVFDYFKDNVYMIDGHIGNAQRPSRIIDVVSGQILRD